MFWSYFFNSSLGCGIRLLKSCLISLILSTADFSFSSSSSVFSIFWLTLSIAFVSSTSLSMSSCSLRATSTFCPSISSTLSLSFWFFLWSNLILSSNSLFENNCYLSAVINKGSFTLFVLLIPLSFTASDHITIFQFTKLHSPS